MCIPTIDLKAYRCPNAQIKANHILEGFIASNLPKICIISVEPSLERSIQHRIAHLDLPISLTISHEETVTQSHIADWVQDFDEEDYEDISRRVTFTVKRKT